MAWCRFFVPKIASQGIEPDDPTLNEHIMYAKCVKGHVLKSADDWILCENLPDPSARCWQEGGDTLFSLAYKKRSSTGGGENEARADAAAQRATS